MREFGFILQKRAYWCSLFVLISLMFVLVAWKWVFNDVYKKRTSLVSSYASFLQQMNTQDSGTSVADTLQAATNEVSTIKKKLDFQNEGRNSTELIPYVVKVLDVISEKHNVKLKSVKPMRPGVVLLFEEMPFDITIMGSYSDLFEWVAEAELALKPMAIKSFQLRPDGAEDGVEMGLRVVSYSLPGVQ